MYCLEKIPPTLDIQNNKTRVLKGVRREDGPRKKHKCLPNSRDDLRAAESFLAEGLELQKMPNLIRKIESIGKTQVDKPQFCEYE